MDLAPRSPGGDTSARRVEWSRALLREAVFQSRARQAADTSLLRSADPTLGGTNCGLGSGAPVDDIERELTPAGRALADQLWPGAAGARPPGALERITRWVERQDALDRKRNHFLRDFRQANGFDRTRYSPAQLAAFEAGLAAINAEEDRQRDAAAVELAELRAGAR